MAGTFTLHYFNIRGYAETARWIFAYTKTPYTDQRYSKEEWPQHKSKMPLGEIPVLEWISADGSQKMTLCQSAAIIHFLANHLGLTGKSSVETAKAEEAFESLREVLEAIRVSMREEDPARKEVLANKAKNEVIPKVFGYLEKRLKETGGKGLAGGDSFTYVDMFLGAFIDLSAGKIDINAYPEVAKVAKGVADSPDIKAWIEKRPQTD